MVKTKVMRFEPIECQTEEQFKVENDKLKEQKYQTIAPSFESLKKAGDELTSVVQKKSILFGETNSLKWKMTFLHFAEGRASVTNPEDFPIGSTVTVIMKGTIQRNGKDIKELAFQRIETQTSEKTAKPAKGK